MNSDDPSEEGGSESNEKNESNGALRRAILKVVCLAQGKSKPRFHSNYEESDVANGNKQDPQRCNTLAGIDEGNTKGQQDPP